MSEARRRSDENNPYIEFFKEQISSAEEAGEYEANSWDDDDEDYNISNNKKMQMRRAAKVVSSQFGVRWSEECYDDDENDEVFQINFTWD